MRIGFSVTEGILRAGQDQLRIHGMDGVREMAKLPKGQQIGRKQKPDKPAPVQLRLFLKTAKGRKFTVLQADTHVVWIGHQTGENKEVMKAIYARAASAPEHVVALDLEKVEVLTKATTTSATGTLDLEF